MHLNDLLKIAAASGASDLHLKVGSYPMMRVRGELTPATEDRRLDHDDMVAVSAAVLPTGHREKFKEKGFRVLLAADPLIDISNTRRIEAVAAAGRLLSGSTLSAGR